MTWLITAISVALLLYAFGSWYGVARNENPLRAKRILHYLTAAAVFFLCLRIGVPGIFGCATALFIVLPVLFPNRPPIEKKSGYGTNLGVHEAANILGITREASTAEINQAWRERMRHHHPDQGGTDHLASLINRARDIMLAHSNNRNAS